MAKINDEFDEFVDRFTQIALHDIDLIKIDKNIVSELLDQNEQSYYIRCWLAQKKLYFGW